MTVNVVFLHIHKEHSGRKYRGNLQL